MIDNTANLIELAEGYTNVDRYDFLQTLRQIRDLEEVATKDHPRYKREEGAA